MITTCESSGSSSSSLSHWTCSSSASKPCRTSVSSETNRSSGSSVTCLTSLSLWSGWTGPSCIKVQLRSLLTENNKNLTKKPISCGIIQNCYKKKWYAIIISCILPVSPFGPGGPGMPFKPRSTLACNNAPSILRS